MAGMIQIPQPAPDRVLMVVCDRDGVVAHIALNERLVRDSDLAEFLNILRDGQEQTRKRRAGAYPENR